MKGEASIKGWHVLAALLGFFGTVIAANAVFITFAVRSFPGQEVEKSYLQGLRFNDEIAAAERQASLGWSARIVRSASLGGRAAFEIELRARNGAPITGLVISGELRRPASDREDRALVFAETGGGRYRSEPAPAASGAYDLSVAALAPNGDAFRFEERVLLP